MEKRGPYVAERELDQRARERENVRHRASDDVSELERRLEAGADTDDRRATVEEDVERKQFQEEVGIEGRQTVRQPRMTLDTESIEHGWTVSS